MFAHGIWGQVATLSNNAAIVICRQIFGAGFAGVAWPAPLFAPDVALAPGVVTWRDGDSCQGTEANYASCSNEPWNVYWGPPRYNYYFYDTFNPLYQVACYNPATGKYCSCWVDCLFGLAVNRACHAIPGPRAFA